MSSTFTVDRLRFPRIQTLLEEAHSLLEEAQEAQEAQRREKETQRVKTLDTTLGTRSKR